MANTKIRAGQITSEAATNGQVPAANGSGGVSWQDPTGGSGSIIYSSAWASPPATPVIGDLWIPTNSPYTARYSGSAWVYFLDGVQVVLPVSADFSWANQGSATIDTSNGGVFLKMAVGAGDNWRLRIKAVPTPPYTVTAAFIPHIFRLNYMAVGLVWYDGTKLVSFAAASNADIPIGKWTNVSTYGNSNYVADRLPTLFPKLLWLRIADDGTNRTCYFSFDGYHWQQIHTIGRTDWLTPTYIGFGVNPNNTFYDAGMWLLHWQVT
jgi:hypothetical protein